MSDLTALTIGAASEALARGEVSSSDLTEAYLARIGALDRTGRIEELARMLAGERVTETTRRQARELLGEAPLRTATR